MLQCEGYKMFYGTMLITPVNKSFPEFKETGTWLYKPEYECWYANGHSYVEKICTILEDNTK